MSHLQRNKSGLLPHVTHPVPIITETSPDAICRDDLESMEWPEVPEEDPGAEGDDLDPGYPRGNMPVNVVDLTSSVREYRDALVQLQCWFETALKALREDLTVLRAVEDLVQDTYHHTYSLRSRRASVDRSIVPIGYDPRYAGLFLAFMYARFVGHVWKIFGAPAMAQQVYGRESKATPLSLVSLLLKSCRLAGMSVLQVIDSRKTFVRGNQKYRSSELQTILAIFRDAHVYKTNSILHICPLVDVPNKNSPSPSPARPSRGTGNQDTETRNLAHEIARHYERFIRVIRADAANYTCFTLAPSYRLQVCSADHPRPSSLLTTNLTIVEDAMWKRFHVEYSHATHHLDLAAHHMRLHKGGVKKGRAYLGLTEAVAKELVEIYDAPSEVIESLVRAGAMEIEEELQLVYSKLPRRCRCDKLFHFYVLAAR